MGSTALSSFTKPETIPWILVVEDEHISRRLLVSLLSSSGFNVRSAGSAEEALVGMKSGPAPAIALVDLNLPGMDGFELINELRKADRDIIPVLITASGDEDVEPRAQAMRVTYLRKPVDYLQLVTILSENKPVH